VIGLLAVRFFTPRRATRHLFLSWRRLMCCVNVTQPSFLWGVGLPVVCPIVACGDALTSRNGFSTVRPLGYSGIPMTQDDRIRLEPGWKEALREEFEQPYMRELSAFLRREKAAGKVIY